MPRPFAQTVVLVLAAVSAVVFFTLLRHKGPVTDDPSVTGSWTDGHVLLVLGSGGAYGIGWATTGGFAVSECGRWRAIEGTVQMRTKWATHASTPSELLHASGIRAGEYRVTPPDRLDLDLRSGREDAGLWRLHRAPVTIDFAEAGKPRLERSCGLDTGP